MAGSVDVAWSEDALDELERFSDFLRQQHPNLASIVAREIIGKAQVLSEFPRFGRPLGGREEYRQLVLQVLNAPTCFSTGSRATAL